MTMVSSRKKMIVFSVILTMMVESTWSQPRGYFPQPGAEAMCLNFTIDFYNKYCIKTVRVGPLSIASVTVQPMTYNTGLQSEMYYRFLGTILVETVCPKTPASFGTSLMECPLVSPNSTMVGGYRWKINCNFKVWYAPALNREDKFKMIYMMCYRE